jgi:hypothetical protein
MRSVGTVIGRSPPVTPTMTRTPLFPGAFMA